MKSRQSIILATCLCSLTLSFTAQALDVTKYERGGKQNRVHLAIVGDGYTADEINSRYAVAVNEFLDYMFEHPTKNTPYPRYKNFINVYQVNVVSEETGVDIPDEGIYVNTALGGERGCTDWRITQVCQVNWQLTHDALDEAEAQFDFSANWRLIMLNDTAFSGATHYPSRGPLAVYSGHYVAPPNGADTRDIALHEGGHAWHGLADEYVNDASATFSGSEPAAANVTTDSTGAKWANWIGYQMPSGLEMGVFEGALYVGNGAYRPSISSKMNGGPDNCHSLDNDCGYNMASVEKAILDIYDIVRPVDAHLPNTDTITNPQQLWVDVVDPEVIMVEWSIDGAIISAATTEQFQPMLHISDPGTYQVTARAWDEVIDHAFSDNANPHPLDLVRKDFEKLQQSVSWTVVVTKPDTDGDGVIDSEDAFPNDATEWADTDADGTGDVADQFPDDPSETTDSDGDGVGDNADAFPNDSSATDPNTTQEPDDGSDSTTTENQDTNGLDQTTEGGNSGTGTATAIEVLALLLLSIFTTARRRIP